MNKKKLAWGGYLVAVHVALAGAALKAWHVPIAHASYLPSPAATIALMRGVHRSMDESVPSGASIFLGDSITQSLATAAVAPVSVNYGIGWQRSDQLLESLGQYRSLQRAGRVFIMIGANDILQGREAGLGARYAKILARVPTGVPVVMSSVPPLAANPAQASAAREEARQACAADRRCRFVDAYQVLSVPGAQQSDGTHLTTAGYALWIKELRAAIPSKPAA